MNENENNNIPAQDDNIQTEEPVTEINSEEVKQDSASDTDSFRPDCNPTERFTKIKIAEKIKFFAKTYFINIRNYSCNCCNYYCAYFYRCI